MYRMLEKETQAAALSTAACSFIFRNVFYKLRYNIKINCFIYFIKACVSALLFQCLYYIMNKYKSFGCISKLQLYTRYQVGITGGRNYFMRKMLSNRCDKIFNMAWTSNEQTGVFYSGQNRTENLSGFAQGFGCPSARRYFCGLRYQRKDYYQ